MSSLHSSRYVGRIGGLAVALGVGTAVFSGAAIATADTPDAPGSQDGTAESPSPSARGPVARGSRQATRAEAPATPRRSSVLPRPAAAATDRGDNPRSGTPEPVAASTPAEAAVQTPPPASVRTTEVRQRRGAVATAVTTSPAAAVNVPVKPAAVVPAALTVIDVQDPTPTPPVAAAATALSSVPDPNALAPQASLKVIGITALSTSVTFALSMLQQIAIAIHVGPSKSTFNQTVELEGTTLVPASTELVTSFYGPWTYGPGGLNIVQGQQRYTVVDSATGQTTGALDALVSTGRPLGLGEYAQLLVTSAEGDAPPVGSIVAQMTILGGLGWSYSAMPSPSGDVVAFEVNTPFGDIPIPFGFNAAKGIADHTVDNRPIDLGNGYSIAPSDPDGEIYTGTSGFLPLFQGVQTRQRFDVRDSSGATVGSFDGVATTTWDAIGAYTEAILVTKSYGDNIGTAPGQVPPPGTVYNVGYSGSDEEWGLYTSMPSPSGNVISMLERTGGRVINALTFPVDRLDASAPPAVTRLPFAKGYAILPTSEFTPVGVNGLPPRDVQIQGYQQFGVYDPDGVQRGSFDAMVTKQWDLLGVSSEAIMVTEVIDGQAGTAAGDVPPVGSVFNYVSFGDSGFGSSYWSLPSPSGPVISYKVRTPLIDIPTWSTYNASAGTDTVIFV